ncbi:BlaI/MecI/CopY family transcriptional regulator [Frankia sp. AgKG'84/4]|uniref:BlaI/MecI/CopY family transcriptional regulator n=1 Tax=Frankia sp. AgKG'84/4 TaxID=573490 RepID=UPI00200E244E|nr:BlaI/MecI/CopY family transcriptional regulator [Frankia sp. AgKG'84/4]MCL9798055.1 BlaI/MecI/CopY family transcriptional regulator [Frankia sp. AgKG'84/4]
MRRTGSARREAGELESVVLSVLWAAEHALTPSQAQEALSRDGHQLAYTSVSTTLARLHAKGLLHRTVAGRGHAYAPSPAAARQNADRMRGLLGEGSGRAAVLSHFVAGLTPDDEATILALLAAAENDGAGPGPAGTDRSPGQGQPGGRGVSGPTGPAQA